MSNGLMNQLRKARAFFEAASGRLDDGHVSSGLASTIDGALKDFGHVEDDIRGKDWNYAVGTAETLIEDAELLMREARGVSKAAEQEAGKMKEVVENLKEELDAKGGKRGSRPSKSSSHDYLDLDEKANKIGAYLKEIAVQADREGWDLPRSVRKSIDAGDRLSSETAEFIDGGQWSDAFVKLGLLEYELDEVGGWVFDNRRSGPRTKIEQARRLFDELEEELERRQKEGKKAASDDQAWEMWEKLKGDIGAEKALSEILGYIGDYEAREMFKWVKRQHAISEVDVDRRDGHGDLIEKFEPFFPSVSELADAVALGLSDREFEEALGAAAQNWNLTLSKQSAKGDIPNYREAGGEKKCGNCGAFDDGHCEMFDAQVEADCVCDDWVEEGEWDKESRMASRIASKALRVEATVPRDYVERKLDEAYEDVEKKGRAVYEADVRSDTVTVEWDGKNFRHMVEFKDGGAVRVTWPPGSPLSTKNFTDDRKKDTIASDAVKKVRVFRKADIYGWDAIDTLQEEL